MDPCGTPHPSLAVIESFSRTFTWNFLLRRYDLNQQSLHLKTQEKATLAVKYNDL